MSETTEHLVVVGASCAGLNGALAVRQAGFDGRLTVIGAEPHQPYDRTLLSKTVPTGEIAPEALALPQAAALDATWRLGVSAVSLDRKRRVVHLADHGEVAYDRLLIATGVRARAWPNPRERQLKGVLVLRDREDAIRLRAALAARPQHVVIVGGGFIGCEIAQAVRSLGLPVTLIETAKAPLARMLGTLVGSIVGAWLEEAGVDLRLDCQITRLEDDGFGHVIRVLLDDGHAIDTPLVVIAIGTVPNTEWLEGSGVALHAKGVDCDDRTRVLGHGGQPDPALFTAGDIAHFPHPLFDGRRIVVDHWRHAEGQGAYAGAMMAGLAPQAPYAALPSAGAELGALSIRTVGSTEGADGLVFAEGDPKSGCFLVAYGRAGRCIAAVSFNDAPGLPDYAELIVCGAPFPPIGRDGLRGDLMVLPLDLV